MSHPLDDAETRCKWACKRFNLLQEEIAVFPRDAQTVKFRQEFDPDANTITVFVADDFEYPIEWALTVSEILYHCRVALDYVAWELRNWQQEIKGNADVEDRITMFLIEPTAEKFAEHRWHLKFLHSDHVAMIEELQPYAALSIQENRRAIADMMAQFKVKANVDWESFDAEAAPTHPLTLLSTLNAQDKHRILRRVVEKVRGSNAGAGPYETVNCEILSMRFFNLAEIHKDAKWAEFNVRPTGANPEVVVGDEIITWVAFGGWRVGSIDPIIKSVVRVIETFKPVWPSQDSPPPIG